MRTKWLVGAVCVAMSWASLYLIVMANKNIIVMVRKNDISGVFDLLNDKLRLAYGC